MIALLWREMSKSRQTHVTFQCSLIGVMLSHELHGTLLWQEMLMSSQPVALQTSLHDICPVWLSLH